MCPADQNKLFTLGNGFGKKNKKYQEGLGADELGHVINQVAFCQIC